jgi:hypothetical protein
LKIIRENTMDINLVKATVENSNEYGSLPYDRDHYIGFRVVKNK